MSMNNVFDVAASALSAQTLRMNAATSNLANAEALAGPDGQTYKARHVVFESYKLPGTDGESGQGVRVREVVLDQSPGKKLYEPNHPMADEQGYITVPNVDVISETTDMIAASRAYQSGVEIMNTAKSMMSKVLTLGQ